MYFNIMHRALAFASLLSLILAVCAAPIPSENTLTGVVKKLKQFDIRNPVTKTNPNRRSAPSHAAEVVRRSAPSPAAEVVRRSAPSPIPEVVN